MKVKFKTSEIIDKLKNHIKIASYKPLYEFNSYLLINAGEKIDMISSSAVELSTVLDGDIVDAGSICIPSSKLYGIISGMDEFILSNTNNGCSIQNAKSKYNLTSIPIGNFHRVSEEELITIGYVDSKLLGSLINKSYTFGLNESEQVFKVIKVEVKDKVLSVASANNSKLSFIKADVDCDDNFSMLIPKEVCPSIVAFLEGYDKISISHGNRGYFISGNDKLSFGTFALKFPDISKLITPGNNKCKFNSKEFNSKLLRVMLTGDRKSTFVTFKFYNGIVELHTNSDFGDGCEEVFTDYVGKDFEISFSAKQVFEFTKHCQRDFLLAFNDDYKRFLFTNHENRYIHDYVLTPLRLE